MATDKKHIAVYLDKNNEIALNAYIAAKPETMKVSAAVNEILSKFFGGTIGSTPSITPDAILADRVTALEGQVKYFNDRLDKLLKNNTESKNNPEVLLESVTDTAPESERVRLLEFELATVTRDKERLDQKLTEVMVELGHAETMRDDWGLECDRLININNDIYGQLDSLLAEKEQLKTQIQQLDTTAIATVSSVAPDPEDKRFQQLNLLDSETAFSELVEVNRLTAQLPSDAIADVVQQPTGDVEAVAKKTYTVSELLKAKKQLIQKHFGSKINDQRLRDWHRSALRGDSGKDNLTKLNVEALPRLDDGKILFVNL